MIFFFFSFKLLFRAEIKKNQLALNNFCLPNKTVCTKLQMCQRVLSTRCDNLYGASLKKHFSGYISYCWLSTSPIHFKRRKTQEERKRPRIIEYAPKSKFEVIQVWKGITIAELAKILDQNINFVKEIFFNEIQNPNQPINHMKYLQEGIRRAGKRMEIIGKPKKVVEVELKDLSPRPPPKREDLKPRPPVVTVMGHVDHGKTTLLDALRDSRTVDKEFGGITQHIGAFSVTLNTGAKVTFLDTPGHAAFSSMRARGANLTDIVVLVVAADDGVMKQTVESVRMARDAKVPILVAINKIDSDKADITKTHSMLLQIGVQVEQLGGDVQAVPISALKKQNLDALKEALVLQAELLQIGGDPNGLVEAVVVDSRIDPRKGKLTTIVVQRGTLRKGNILLAGLAMAKVRILRDADGHILNEVPPGYPAEVEGWRDLPAAGDIILQVQSEKEAKDVIRTREIIRDRQRMEEEKDIIFEKQEKHQSEYKEKLQLKRNLGRYRMKAEGPRTPEMQNEDDHPSLNLILKTDVDGTLEAIMEILDTYTSHDCQLNVIHYGVGPVSQSDVELAKTFKCMIYCFNTDVLPTIKTLFDQKNLRQFNVIYRLIDDIKSEINKRLPAKEVENILGTAKVLQKIEISQGRKKIPIAGCRCVEGMLDKDAWFKLNRNGEVIFQGTAISLRHLKNEVQSIKEDTECGIQLSDSTLDFQKGDIIICFEKNTVQQQTDWDPGF